MGLFLTVWLSKGAFEEFEKGNWTIFFKVFSYLCFENHNIKSTRKIYFRQKNDNIIFQ